MPSALVMMHCPTLYISLCKVGQLVSCKVGHVPLYIDVPLYVSTASNSNGTCCFMAVREAKILHGSGVLSGKFPIRK